MSEIKLPINNSWTQLGKLKPDDVRLANWNELLPDLFELERDLLEYCSKLDVAVQMVDDEDIPKADLLNELHAMHEAYKAKVKIYTDKLYAITTRLNDCVTLIPAYMRNIRESMDNKYYGYSRDGQEVWSGLNPRNRRAT